MRKSDVDFKKIPLAHRWVLVFAPGFFLMGDEEVKTPVKAWESELKLSEWLLKRYARVVAFRRFIYDPGVGRVFLDKGLHYFGGKLITAKNFLESDEFAGTRWDTAKANIQYNCFKRVVYFEKFDKVYPLERNDVFVEGVNIDGSK